MEMKLTRVDISKMFDMHLLCKMHKVQVFTCTRAAAEAAGISSVCAFADTTNRYIVLIEDDCDQLSAETVKAIMCHELAHIAVPSITEAQADEFAERFTSCAVVKAAREETELVRQRIRYARAGIPSLDIV